ncbi:nucleoside diphosphate kinase regulator [Aminobacter sp. P9b]|uniref:Regulator of nucleoside diphosphate kinase n=1 Tax=Aminobacter niigataensis TaxID=83265 RepID=A0ABR6L1U4_9HYPH|nr:MULTISPECIES: nucleoside diphosphate kinase regulator [Aminobacter]AWC21830.1 Regulator of nucleoside diphosphate kinase [Aminobacter sp. MSH1]KQU73013.1 nucleoside diphosphate kinase regulator [Aminobacter sp. DSM 101952]MBB4650764.1 regulator of nucleoside diphosphate kinase [Aminobacter niigataensis]CAI2932595.1 Regulator of nucleoside diphosphate kinase [Aminobacter niigataensis]
MRLPLRQNIKQRREHEIVLSESDHAKLTGLAESSLDRLPEIAEELLSEMDRAKIKPLSRIPANVIRMGSKVTFRSGDGEVKTVTLVYPGKADIAEGKVSILTPVGAALIGLREGQSVAWTSRAGRRLEIEIVSVEAPVEGVN